MSKKDLTKIIGVIEQHGRGAPAELQKVLEADHGLKITKLKFKAFQAKMAGVTAIGRGNPGVAVQNWANKVRREMRQGA